MATKLALAWLAGFWDGEGSIGITVNGSTRILNCQLSHTDYPSIVHALDVLASAGIGGRGYTYQERDPAKHRDAHYIRINGMANVRHMAIKLIPFAVTKARHWELAIEFANSRIALAGGVDQKGHLLRGKDTKQRGYSENDLALAAELSQLNRRGPDDRKRRAEGRIKP